MAKVTGIGGVFFKARGDRAELVEWYREILGMELADFGGSILFWGQDSAPDGGITVWHIAEADTDWFAPGNAAFMVNYRIDDMDGMVSQLQDAGVTILQGPESHENGRFLWILDPEGNKVELWEPAAVPDDHGAPTKP